MNRKLIINFIFPTSVILFLLFTKWWIVNAIERPDAIMYGFPFIYRAPAFYTSLAQHYFITELIADFMVYFAVILGVVFVINRFMFEIKIRKIVSVILFIIALLLIINEIVFATILGNRISLKRDYDIEVKQTGFDFPFNTNDTKEFDNYHQ